MAKSEEELKILLTKVKEESEKAGLKFNSQKTKIKASGSITSWQIKEEKVETETDFIFLGSKITVDSACSHEIKRHLQKKKKKKDTCSLKGKCPKNMLKSRDITLSTKFHTVKAMVFPVVMYG